MPNQTGPRTPEGKQSSSQNHRQHGLATANIIVVPEERPFFDQIESELRDEIKPDGPLEAIAFRRLVTANWQMEKCQQREATLIALEPNDQNEANLDRVRRYYQRWEGSYNSAFRQLRLLQTDRGLKCVADNNWPEFFAPLADVSKIERFAKRITRPAVPPEKDTNSAPTPSNQAKSTLCETKPDRYPERERRAAEPPSPPLVDPILSALCETKHPKVGRNAPCPCGSGVKYKRCCGPNAAPILNKAA